MKLLYPALTQMRDSPVIALFGSGLIGGAVDAELHGIGFRGEHHPVSWESQELRSVQFDTLVHELRSNASRIVVIWAAGVSGFDSDMASMDDELAAFAEVVELSGKIKADRPGRSVDFHMVSSAGGLFEGITNCGRDTEPCPKRPYGRGKLAQEDLLLNSPSIDRRAIYRPSSVYGFTRGGRLGLISAILQNASLGRVSRIFGHPDTLRDYVFADDIARYIVRKSVGRDHGPVEINLVASGRPVPINEIIGISRSIVRSPIFLQYEATTRNSLHTTFLPSSLPDDWAAVPVDFGIAATYSKISGAVDAGRIYRGRNVQT